LVHEIPEKRVISRQSGFPPKITLTLKIQCNAFLLPRVKTKQTNEQKTKAKTKKQKKKEALCQDHSYAFMLTNLQMRTDTHRLLKLLLLASY